jgi:DNA recombination protein RmuC
MNFAAILIVAAAAALAAWGASALARRRRDAQLAVLRQEMQTLAAGQAQAVTAQLGQLSQSFGQQIGQVTQQVQSGMASAGSLASEAQRAVSEQLQSATSMMGHLQRQLGEVQQSGRDLSLAAHTIESVLGGAKSRGTLGEVALDRLLTDTLPPASFEMQHRFSTGEIVDAVVRFRDKLLPIDSKFPLDDYRRMVEEGEEARRAFSQAVRAHADSIAKKYILPGEDTLEIALMFVPSEGVYYELLRSEDTKGVLLDEYCRRKGVIAVSPSTLYAHLSVILMGLRGMQIEENARHLLSSLGGLKKQWETFGDVYEKLGTHLRNAQQSYAEADRRLERARTELDLMAEGSLPEATATAPALESVVKRSA